MHGQILQCDLPQAAAAAIAAAAVGRDQQFSSTAITLAPIFFHQRRIACAANCAVSWSMPTLTQPWFSRQVVDPVGNRLAQLLIHEIVDPDLFGLAFGLPFTSTILELDRPVPSSWCRPKSPAGHAAETAVP